MSTTRRWRFSIGTALLTAAVMVFGMPVAEAGPWDRDPLEPPPVGEEEYQAPANGFDWRAPSRFGRDDNGDGITDYHWNDLTRPAEHDGPPETYDPDWVHPDSFPIEFDGCPTKEEAAKSDANIPTANTYTWEINGLPYGDGRDCRLVGDEVRLPGEGVYPASLTITKPDGTTEGPYVQEVTVRDFLIVSIGDSYGSGEGNPDIPRVDAEGVKRDAQWVDRRCHRSAHAGAAQTARRIEASDRKTTVTFLSFACSGSTIDTLWGTTIGYPYAPLSSEEKKCALEGDDPTCTNPGTGILGPYKGVEPPEGAAYLPSQLEQLKAAVTHPNDPSAHRTVDSLIVSGGGNDAGFAPAASVCVLWIGSCPDEMVDSQTPGEKVRLHDRLAQDVGALEGKYNQLDAALDASGIPIAQTYVTEYPGPTTGDDGLPCSAMLDDVLHPNLLGVAAGQVLLSPLLLFALLGPVAAVVLVVLGAVGFLWTQTRAMAGEEVIWAERYIAPEINTKLKEAAQRHRWTYVDGIGEPYAGHGYCASDPYVRRASESSVIQGPFGFAETLGIHSATTGTLHPNVIGHQMYANQLTALLSDQLALADGAAEFTVLERNEGHESRHGKGGWLTGRCPIGSSACTSDAAVVTVEARDPSGVKGAEFTVDGRPECPPGVVCTAALVDPFTYRWTFTIAGDGIRRLGFSLSNRFGHVSTFGREVKVDLHDPTAAAALESPTAPTGLRFEGHDGRGSGVDQIAFEGLWHGNSPGSTAPGQTVAIDLGGTYALRFRAVDEAGRTGPWQTQEITVGGPTMAASSGVRGASAWASQGCGQFPDESIRDYNSDSGLPVASSTARTHANAVPARQALAARARAQRQSPGLGNGNEDCDANASIGHVPLTVGAGTSGLAAGDPVALRATVRVPGAMKVDPAAVRDFLSLAEVDASFQVSAPECGEGCTSPEAAVRFSTELRKYVAAPSGPLGELYGDIMYYGEIASNREPGTKDEFYDEYYGGCTWPCPGPGSTNGWLAWTRLPTQEFTVTFDSHVGARHSVAGDLSVLTQAYATAGTDVWADADFSAAIEIEPAAGFEGVEVAYGNPQPNLAPDAVDDAATVEGSAATTIDVLANDTDPDGNTLTVTEVAAPAHGTATIDDDGRVTYTPGESFGGHDSFTYTVSDGWGGEDTAVVRVRHAGARTPPADFDGDGDSDVAVFRPSTGTWFVNDGLTAQWGTAGDVAVPGDYDGDSKTDLAVFRPDAGIWFVKDGPTLAWGTAGDIPVPGDYDGDGKTDLAVYRPSIGVWFVKDGPTRAWGTAGDIPVPGDYDGDGDTDRAVYRPSTGVWFVQGGTPEFTAYGAACETPPAHGDCDVPVPADYDGDGDTDRAVFRPGSGSWFVSGGSPEIVVYGTAGDVPVPGDYDADGQAERAVFRPGVGLWFVRGATPEVTAWGTTGDDALPLTPSVRSVYFPPR